MKPKTILTLLMVVVAITACAQNNTFKISGQIQEVSDDDFAILYKVHGQLIRPFRKFTIKNGVFIIEGETDSLEVVHLRMEGDKYPMRTISVWISPGSKTEIIGKGHYINSWNINSNVAEQVEEEFYRNYTKNQLIGLDSLSQLYHHKIKKWDNLKSDSSRKKLKTEVQSINKQQDSLAFLAHCKTLELMENQPITKIWLNHLVDNSTKYAKMFINSDYYPQNNVKLLQNLYNRLTDEQKQSSRGQTIYANVFPIKEIEEGDVIAQGRFCDSQGVEHEIVDFVNKGKNLLLDFWSMGCAPCIAALPEMKEIHELHQDKLTIISISTDTRDVWLEGLKKHQLPWINLNDFKGISGYAACYGVRNIPFYTLISPDGIVEKTWSGYGKGSSKEKLKDMLN